MFLVKITMHWYDVVMATCVECGGEYLVRRKWQRFCCVGCRNRFHGAGEETAMTEEQEKTIVYEIFKQAKLAPNKIFSTTIGENVIEFKVVVEVL